MDLDSEAEQNNQGNNYVIGSRGAPGPKGPAQKAVQEFWDRYLPSFSTTVIR